MKNLIGMRKSDWLGVLMAGTFFISTTTPAGAQNITPVPDPPPVLNFPVVNQSSIIQLHGTFRCAAGTTCNPAAVTLGGRLIITAPGPGNASFFDISFDVLQPKFVLPKPPNFVEFSSFIDLNALGIVITKGDLASLTLNTNTNGTWTGAAYVTDNNVPPLTYVIELDDPQRAGVTINNPDNIMGPIEYVFPVVDGTSLLTLNGLFFCDPGADCSAANAALKGRLRITDGIGNISFFDVPFILIELKDIGTNMGDALGYSAVVDLGSLGVTIDAGQASLQCQNNIRGSWTGTAYVEQENLVPQQNQAQAAFSFGPYVSPLADPRPHPIILLP